MKASVARIKGVGFLLWHARHEFYHILLGLVWAWALREWWREFNARWIWWSVVGSILPDFDHFFYFYGYGRRDWYSQMAKQYLKSRQWRRLWLFIENGHKYNTSLLTHNYFMMAGLLLGAYLSSFIEWQVGVILFGAMLIHYLFDILDDYFILGSVNPNWKRWGRGRRKR